MFLTTLKSGFIVLSCIFIPQSILAYDEMVTTERLTQKILLLLESRLGRKLKPQEFEVWVNGFYKAEKPRPDKEVFGITQENVAIPPKAFVKPIDYIVVELATHEGVKTGCYGSLILEVPLSTLCGCGLARVPQPPPIWHYPQNRRDHEAGEQVDDVGPSPGHPPSSQTRPKAPTFLQEAGGEEGAV